MGNERSYSPGWCTWWAAHELPWIPAGLGNADTWPARAKADGLHLTSTPTVGSCVCYGPGGGYSSLGHVAVVTAVHPRGVFTVSEMAYVAWDKVDLRTSNLQDVVGFILKPGTGAGKPPPTPPPSPTDAPAAVAAVWGWLGGFLGRDLPALNNAVAIAAGGLRRL